jgi:putative transposase
VRVEACNAWGGVDWPWHAAATMRGKARMGGGRVGRTPTDRGRKGGRGVRWWKRQAVPWASRALGPTPPTPVVDRPQLTAAMPQPRCVDKGGDHPTGHEAVAAYHFTPHSRRIGEGTSGASGDQRFPARRWVADRTLAWRSKSRGLLVQDETQAINVLGLGQPACALIGRRRRARLIGD